MMTGFCLVLYLRGSEETLKVLSNDFILVGVVVAVGKFFDFLTLMEKFIRTTFAIHLIFSSLIIILLKILNENFHLFSGEDS